MNVESNNVAPVSSPKIELSDFLENEPPEVIEAKLRAKRYRMPYIDLLPPDAPSPVDQDELDGDDPVEPAHDFDADEESFEEGDIPESFREAAE